MAKESLAGLVNASGFALQLAIEHLVRSTTGLGWRVTSVEHPWRQKASGAEGFIDLVLQKGAVTWVVECKRPRDGVWVFLVPDSRPKTVHRVRCLWVAGATGGPEVAGWDDLALLPESPEASYCVIRGTGEGDRTLLERLSGIITLSLDCLVEEEIEPFKVKKQEYWGVYLPVLVTTAKLHVCRFDPARVSLTDGTVDSTTFEEVPVVRFRKALSPEVPPGDFVDSLDGLAQAKERTILVVNAQTLAGVLGSAELKIDKMFDKWPWTKALEKIALVRAARESARKG